MSAAPPVRFARPVTLVGGGALERRTFERARAVAPEIVAADGGADRVAAFGRAPVLAIGDMDSIGPAGRAASGRLLHIAEQDTTDFEKCLRATEAPFYVGAGFTGARLDHTLGALSVLLAHRAKKVVLVSETEVITALPAGVPVSLTLSEGEPVSIFPLREVTGRSEGLRWPIDGLVLRPGERIATSNEASCATVRLGMASEGALLMLAPCRLPELIAALGFAR